MLLPENSQLRKTTINCIRNCHVFCIKQTYGEITPLTDEQLLKLYDKSISVTQFVYSLYSLYGIQVWD
jgi:hypothetical protein